MSGTIYKTEDEQVKYSKILSSLFCSTSIISLSILSLLNNLSIDIYSAYVLLKVVVPASICFWIIGFVIGKILDTFNNKITVEKITEEKKAYEIPSMFSADTQYDTDDEFGILWKNSILTSMA